MTPEPDTTADRLRACRLRDGRTQAAVARLLGVTPAVISQAEAGLWQPAPGWLLHLSAVTGWPAGDLDPALRGLSLPADRVALRPVDSAGRQWEPATAADAARLEELGATAPIRSADLTALARSAEAANWPLVLLPRLDLDDSAAPHGTLRHPTGGQ